MELANPLEDSESGSSEQRCNIIDVHLFTQESHERCIHIFCPPLVTIDCHLSSRASARYKPEKMKRGPHSRN